MTPEALHPPTGADNVETARKTLRMLRNLQNNQLDMEYWLQIGELPAQIAKAELFQTLIETYAGLSKLAQLTNPELLNHFTIENANFAAGSIALSIALHTLDILPENHPEFAALDASLDAVPEAWDIRLAQSVERLTDDLESGLTHLAGRPMGDKSPIDQLLEISEKIQQTARELYSIDTLEEPAREESIELAREILRRLKNMLFSDKPIEDAIDTGKPNDKLAFARKIGEMVDMYKNLLAQAALSNPEIMQDARVQMANGAVRDCADGVALMANKELPENRKKKDDEEQNQMARRSTKNLVKSVEEGVETASKEIGKNQEQSQKNEQNQKNTQAQAQAQMRAEAARAARRRMRQERAAAVQAANPPPKPPPRPPVIPVQQPVRTQKTGIAGLNLEAINAVRQAGSTLKNINKQATSLLQKNAELAAQSTKQSTGGGDKRSKSDVATVPADDKISPDDKSFAQRKLEQDKNDPRNRPRIV